MAAAIIHHSEVKSFLSSERDVGSAERRWSWREKVGFTEKTAKRHRWGGRREVNGYPRRTPMETPGQIGSTSAVIVDDGLAGPGVRGGLERGRE